MLRALGARRDPGAADVDPDRGIGDGDLVIVYESFDSMKPVRVQSGKVLQNRFGLFPHESWIGRPFGSKALCAKRGGDGCSGAPGFVTLLAPTPELWTKVLPHRTQILYLPDIAIVVSSLGLRPGSTVLESGTGSGSLTHSLARAVAPGGRVHTFDFHEHRAQAARDEFSLNGLGPLVSVGVRDIQSFGFPPELAGSADAIFLDLPGPWLAVGSAAASLRPGGTFCAFSPCIEQVQRCCEALRKERFTDLKPMEVLLRAYDIQTAPAASDTQDGPQGATGKVEEGEAGRREGEGQGAGQHEGEGQPQQKRRRRDEGGVPGATRPVWARPAAEARGHTGYLLFARKNY